MHNDILTKKRRQSVIHWCLWPKVTLVSLVNNRIAVVENVDKKLESHFQIDS